jgi:hypothetical protein
VRWFRLVPGAAWLGLVACAVASPPRSQTTADDEPRANLPPASAAVITLDASAPLAEPPDAGPERPRAELEPVSIVLERSHERARPAGAVDAALADEQVARWNLGGSSDPARIANQANYHPATRVQVDLRVTAGKLPTRARAQRLSEASLLAQARRQGYWPFRNCFEQALRSGRELRGRSVIRFAIAKSGRARNARLVRTDLTDRSVGKCLEARVGALVFSPAPQRQIGVELSVGLWPGDAPLAVTAPEREPAYDALVVERVVAPLESALADCYRAGLERDASLWGRVQLRVEVDATGRVTAAREEQSKFPDREVVACIAESTTRAEFPEPKAGPGSIMIGLRLGAPPP